MNVESIVEETKVEPKKEDRALRVPSDMQSCIVSKAMYKIPTKELNEDGSQKFQEVIVDKHSIVNFAKRFKKDVHGLRTGNIKKIGYDQLAVQYDYIQWIKKEHPEFLKAMEILEKKEV